MVHFIFEIVLLEEFATNMMSILEVVVHASFAMHQHGIWEILPSNILYEFAFLKFERKAGIIVTEIARVLTIVRARYFWVRITNTN